MVYRSFLHLHALRLAPVKVCKAEQTPAVTALQRTRCGASGLTLQHIA